MRNTTTLRMAFVCALRGIVGAVRAERNLKIEAGCALCALLAAAVLDVGAMGWVAVLTMIALVMGAELCNCAIETLVDMVSPQLSPLAQKAKDTAAGAVLLAAFVSVVVGLIIFIPALLRLVSRA
ncbi:MAG: diacylglycerol kinase family protein [Coriobacteriales bacterium]|jgi:diacylglycerol kinase|nr:diacylglycerol kinase family protein [Coriobacteriales bacterium]